ncbi:MAG: DMT family transporter [Sneathiellaceae bacterium]
MSLASLSRSARAAARPSIQAWLALSDNTRGIVWMLVSGVLFSCMAALIKHVGTHFDAMQMAFFRTAFGLLAILPFVFLSGGLKVIRTRRFGGHLMRGLCGATAMFAMFYAISELPLAEATAYTFTKPLFLVLLAALFLGEKIRLRRATATAVGFSGILLMMQGQGFRGELEWAAVVALGGAAMVAVVVVQVKRLMRTEAPITVLFWFGVISTLLTAIPALLVWVHPTWEELLLLIAIGVTGASAQSCLIRGYRVAEATVIAPFDYVRLLYAGAFGFFLFGEVPGWWMLAGAGVVVAATLYIAFRETQLGKRRQAPLIDQLPLKPDHLVSHPEDPPGAPPADKVKVRPVVDGTGAQQG